MNTDGDRPVWITLGGQHSDPGEEHVRVDQIARWSDSRANGHQHFLSITLLNGREIRAEVTHQQWNAFLRAMG